MDKLERRNVVGEFADARSAREAVRSLEQAGFDPDDVAVITGNPRQARELSGSRSPQGASVGLVIGLLVFGAFIALGGPVMWSNPVALALGLAGFAGAGLVIGWLAGRARIFVVDRAARYETAEDIGDRLVSVSVPDRERDRARQALRSAGAVRIREEGTVEAA
jgi:hypothetical protein